MAVFLCILVGLLRLPTVQELTGLSPTTIWRREKAGQFPRRRRVGPNAVAWRSDEVDEWIRSRPLADEDPEAPAGTEE